MSVQKCTHKNCDKEGRYKAPTSHDTRQKYTWLCLEHIREHNAKWDYLAGCNESEIELKIRQSTVWERPTWPFNQAPRPYSKTKDSPSAKKTLPKQVQKAAQILTLSPPLSLRKTKENYRMLAKRYHPDANNGKSADIEKFYHLQSAFKLMQDYLQKKA